MASHIAKIQRIIMKYESFDLLELVCWKFFLAASPTNEEG